MWYIDVDKGKQPKDNISDVRIILYYRALGNGGMSSACRMQWQVEEDMDNT